METSKIKKVKSLSKNTLLFTIGSFGTRLVTFFLVPLYTLTLTTSEYGTIDLISTTVQLLIPLFTVNIQDAILRYALDEDKKRENVLRVGLSITGLSTIVLGLIILALYLTGIVKLPAYYWLYLLISYILGALNNTLVMFLKAKNEIRQITIWGIANTLITCLTNIFTLLFMRLGLAGYMISMLSGVAFADLGMIIGGKVYIDLLKSQSDRSLSREMLHYSKPLVVNSLSWWINNASDRYILTYFCGTSLNGIYSVAYKIPSILTTIQSVFYNAWSISAITEFNKGDSDGFISNITDVYWSLSIMGCSAIMVLNIPLATILYSNEFFSAWKYVPILLIAALFNGLGLFNGCFFTAVKRTKEISRTTLVGAIVNTTLNFLLIPNLGAFGASIATAIGYFCTWGLRQIKLRSIIHLSIKWKSQIIGISMLVIQCSCSILLKSFFIQIACFLLEILIYHENIIKMIFYIRKYFIRSIMPKRFNR